MHKRALAIIAAGAALLGSSATALSQQNAPPSPVLALMLGTMVPASEVIFSAQAEPPKTRAGWTSVQKAAETLQESGGQLTRAPLARTEPEWTDLARALVAASQIVATAAATQDEDVLLEAGDEVYVACDTCHRRFLRGPR